jgi:tRNA1Val (adenine37-N6)-methyltransferase
MRLVHPYADRPANMVLIEAVRGGGSQLIVDMPLVMYDRDGGYTRELLEATGQ